VNELGTPGVHRPTNALDIFGFLAFSHGWTWLFWAAAGFRGTSVWEQPATVLFVIGGAGVFMGIVAQCTSPHSAHPKP